VVDQDRAPIFISWGTFPALIGLVIVLLSSVLDAALLSRAVNRPASPINKLIKKI